MEYNVEVTQKTFSKLFLTAINGTLRLTEKELDVCAVICDRYVELLHDGLKEPYLSKFVFSAEGKKLLCSRLGDISTTNLGNKLKILKDKGALEFLDGNYAIYPNILPRNKITFNFVLEANAK